MSIDITHIDNPYEKSKEVQNYLPQKYFPPDIYLLATPQISWSSSLMSFTFTPKMFSERVPWHPFKKAISPPASQTHTHIPVINNQHSATGWKLTTVSPLWELPSTEVSHVTKVTEPFSGDNLHPISGHCRNIKAWPPYPSQGNQKAQVKAIRRSIPAFQFPMELAEAQLCVFQSPSSLSTQPCFLPQKTLNQLPALQSYLRFCCLHIWPIELFLYSALFFLHSSYYIYCSITYSHITYSLLTYYIFIFYCIIDLLPPPVRL